MHRLFYIADPSVSGFITFVRRLEVDGHQRPFMVGYDPDRVAVHRICEAGQLPNAAGQEPLWLYHARQSKYQEELKEALQRCSEATYLNAERIMELELLFVAVRALEWAGVRPGTLAQMFDLAERQSLEAVLRHAVAALTGDEDEVHNAPWHSDTALTHLYALLGERIAPYDEAMGAGLGLLTRRFLEQNGQHVVPELLAFPGGPAGDAHHDASAGQYQFPQRESGRAHARWNIRANWIVHELAQSEELRAMLGGTVQSRFQCLELGIRAIGRNVWGQ